MMRSDRAALRTFATVRFIGSLLQPAAVTDLLGIAPTHSYRAGETYRSGSDARVLTRRTSLWMLDTEDAVESRDLRRHIAFVQHLLVDGGPDRAVRDPSLPKALRSLIRGADLTFDVSLFWYGARHATHPKVDAELTKLVASIGGAVIEDFEYDAAPDGSAAVA